MVWILIQVVIDSGLRLMPTWLNHTEFLWESINICTLKEVHIQDNPPHCVETEESLLTIDCPHLFPYSLSLSLLLISWTKDAQNSPNKVNKSLKVHVWYHSEGPCAHALRLSVFKRVNSLGVLIRTTYKYIKYKRSSFLYLIWPHFMSNHTHCRPCMMISEHLQKKRLK